MKIKDLNFIDKNLLSKLRGRAEMEVTEFLDMIENMMHLKINVNKPYRLLYDMIIQQLPQINTIQAANQSQPMSIVSMPMELDSIPTEELKYYFPQDAYIIERLKTGGYDTLGKLYMATAEELGQLPSVGRTTLTTILRIKDVLEQNATHYIDEWRDSLTIHEFPANYNRSNGLLVNLQNSFIEYAKIIETNLQNPRYLTNSQSKESFYLLSSILTQYYQDGRSCTQIAAREGYTLQHIEIIRHQCVEEVARGDVVFKNYRLNQGLLDLLQSLRDECLFESIQNFQAYTKSSDTSLLGDIGYDTLKIEEVELLVPKDTKGIYRKVWSVIKKVLLDNPLPTDKDYINQQVIESQELANAAYDSLFIERMLECSELIVDCGNNQIQLKNEYLTNAAQRYARIIFESNDKLTTEEVRRRYEAIYGNVTTSNISVASRFGVSCQGKRHWYYGQPKAPIQQKVTEFAEDNIQFYYSDAEKALQNEGYCIPKAFRAYITNVCAVDNEDSNHFCHKDYVDDFPSYNWRSPSKYGRTNWIFNEIKNVIAEKGPLLLSVMIDELEERSHSAGYQSVKKRVQYNSMAGFCGEDKPFIISDGYVVINQPVFDTTVFETIGLRGEKYAYYHQIRSLVANEVKKVDSGRISFIDIVNMVRESIDESLSRNTILRAIKDDQHRFASINVEVLNENGILIVRLLSTETKSEPIYTVMPMENSFENEQVIEVDEERERPDIRYRQQIDWEALKMALKRELAFYGRWMSYEHIELNQAVDSFIHLISHSANHNLRKILPLDLYEYWFASTDSYDRNRYLTDLLFMFEDLLVEVYSRLHNETLQRKGLANLVKNFDGLSDLMLYSRDAKGFNRIASCLHYQRDIVTHGGTLDLDSVRTAQAITDNVALYVYIVAKYAQGRGDRSLSH